MIFNVRPLMKITQSLFLAALFLAGCSHSKPDTEWRDYGGNHAGNRYSPLHEINAGNVQMLRPAWVYHSAGNPAQNSQGSDQEIQCQPIVVHGILYGLDPALKLFALDRVHRREHLVLR
jgi:quinoprotein glucose dehydrogenase